MRQILLSARAGTPAAIKEQSAYLVTRRSFVGLMAAAALGAPATVAFAEDAMVACTRIRTAAAVRIGHNTFASPDFRCGSRRPPT